MRRVKVTDLRNLKIFGCHFKVMMPTLVAEKKNRLQRGNTEEKRNCKQIKKGRKYKNKKKRNRKSTEKRRKKVYKEKITRKVLHKMGEKIVVSK